MHLAANVARHGDGGACTKLLAKAPQLWTRISFDYDDIAPAPVPTSEELRIGQDELRRYARAVVHLWGHADPLSGAVLVEFGRASCRERVCQYVKISVGAVL